MGEIEFKCEIDQFSSRGQGSCQPYAAGDYVNSACPGFTCATTYDGNGVAQMPQCDPWDFSLRGGDRCVTCPVGYKCTTASAFPWPCEPGTAQDHINGLMVAETSNVCDPCNPGEYAFSGQTTCFSCPEGYFCPDVTLPPRRCPPGTYSAPGAIECIFCDTAGNLCKDAVSSDSGDALCPRGMYCDQNSVVAGTTTTFIGV